MKAAKFFLLVFAGVVCYFGVSYLLLPDVWKHYEHRPELEAYPKYSVTREGLPGDPLNVGLAGTEPELRKAMELAGWKMADPLRLVSDFKIAEDVLLGKSYPGAPISRLYLFTRPQDLAFEKQSGGTPVKRHHVRFWRTEITGRNGRPLWIGSATFDRAVGLNRYTGQLTHHIAPDIDRERDGLIQDLAAAGQLTLIYQVSGVGPALKRYNGGGDPYFTDGELTAGVISPGNQIQAEPPKRLKSPAHVEAKNGFWTLLRGIAVTGFSEP